MVHGPLLHQRKYCNDLQIDARSVRRSCTCETIRAAEVPI